jgi:hypothetical protein
VSRRQNLTTPQQLCVLIHSYDCEQVYGSLAVQLAVRLPRRTRAHLDRVSMRTTLIKRGILEPTSPYLKTNSTINSPCFAFQCCILVRSGDGMEDAEPNLAFHTGFSIPSHNMTISYALHTLLTNLLGAFVSDYRYKRDHMVL